MKMLKLAAIPMALAATSAFAAQQDVVVVEQQPVAVTTTTYDANSGLVKNSTTQVVDGTKTIFGTIFHPASVSAEVGSLGYGAHIGWGVNDKTELVAGWAGGDVGKLAGNDFKAKGVKYKLDETDFSNPYLGVEMRPAANWFTVGTGVIFPDNNITVKSDSNRGYFTVDGVNYGMNDSTKLKGKLEYRNDVAPYLTVGFRPNINNHWGVFGEVGAAYLGKADATVTGTGTVNVLDSNRNTTGLTAATSTVANRVAKDIEDKDIAEWLPIAKLGVTYRF